MLTFSMTFSSYILWMLLFYYCKVMGKHQYCGLSLLGHIKHLKPGSCKSEMRFNIVVKNLYIYQNVKQNKLKI